MTNGSPIGPHDTRKKGFHMITEKIIVGQGTGYPLDGILTLPSDSPGPVPAVVFVHGSGSSNMDERIGKLTPFKDLAEGLARRGIASLRYDKRTYTHGKSMVKFSEGPITVKEETIDDALIATALLRRDPRVDPDGIFVIGHSMGGMLAPRIDAEGGDYKGLVLMAGTPRRLEEVMIEQNEEAFESMGGLMQRMSRNRIGEINEILRNVDRIPDGEAKEKRLGHGTTLYYFKEMGKHPTPRYLTSTDKPILIMQGDRDFQVKPDRDYAEYKRLLDGRPNVTFKLYEGLNHAFVPALYSSIKDAKKEYGVERHIGEDVIGDIADWILANSS